MKKPKLIIKLWRPHPCSLAMYVEHQDESLRARGALYKNNGKTLVSDCEPRLTSIAVHIHGINNHYDHRIHSFDYFDQEACSAMIAFIKEAVAHINGQDDKQDGEVMVIQ